METGSITLSWKCPNPAGAAGTIYEVQRKLGSSPTAAFEFVGGTGVRSFTDETLPLGPTLVTYRITAVRSTTRGNPAQFISDLRQRGRGLHRYAAGGRGGAGAVERV